MIITPLLPHQQEPVTRAVDMFKTRGFTQLGLFMFVGSGKSLVALTIADAIGARNILITTDKDNALTTWPDQIARHTDLDVLVREREPVPLGEPCCYVINYDLLKECAMEYMSMHWDLWIGDEASSVKDPRTDRHKVMRHIVRDTRNRLILNASLMTEKLEDIYGQLVFIGGEPRIGHTFTQFRNRYMQPNPYCPGWVPKRSAFAKVQRAIEDVSYFLKDTGEVDMPEPEYKHIHVPMTDEQRRLDDELKLTFAACFDGSEIETNYAPVVFQKRVQLCGGIFRPTDEDADIKTVPTGKLDVLVRLCRANPDAKIAVWHHYIPETTLIENTLHDAGIVTVTVAGLSDKKKVQVLKEFEKVERGVLLIRTSMSKGLNQLADVDIAVYYSNPFSYQNRAQSEGRSRRVSSTTTRTVYVDLLTVGGVDELVYHTLNQKKSFSLTLDSLADIVESNRR